VCDGQLPSAIGPMSLRVSVLSASVRDCYRVMPIVTNVRQNEGTELSVLEQWQGGDKPRGLLAFLFFSV